MSDILHGQAWQAGWITIVVLDIGQNTWMELEGVIVIAIVESDIAKL